MIIYFASRTMDIIGLASSEMQGGFRLDSDLKIEDIESGVASLEFNLYYDDETVIEAREITRAGNYILLNRNGKGEYYTIVETEDKDGKIDVYAEDAGMDLLNEICDPFTADKAYNIAWYVNKFASDSGFEIGYNEVSELTRKLKWEGEATSAERIRSVATQFGAEIGYRFEIDGLALRKKYIDIYKKRGKDVAQELRLNRDIESITIKTSIAQIATGLRVTGGKVEGSDNPVTLKGYTYDDGDFYVSTGRLYSRTALAEWSRYRSETGSGVGHIVRNFTSEATTQNTLLVNAINELKKLRNPIISYDVNLINLPENLQLGDYVRIVDDDGELYLSARILKLKLSEVDEKQTAELGDYVVKSSGIATRLQELAEQVAQIDYTTSEISTSVYVANATAEEAKETAESVSSTAEEAKEVANLASTKAVTAQTVAETAQATAAEANDTLTDWKYEDTEEIDGEKLYNGTVKAEKIDVTDLFAQDITATGTITGATLKGGSLIMEKESDGVKNSLTATDAELVILERNSNTNEIKWINASNGILELMSADTTEEGGIDNIHQMWFSPSSGEIFIGETEYIAAHAVNNLMTTERGYALDARQGNVLRNWFYQPGDTVTWRFDGSTYITGSLKKMAFTAIFEKPIAQTVSTITVSSYNITVRQDNKYLAGSASSGATSGHTVSFVRNNGNWRCTVAANSAYSGTNNSPVGISIQCSLRFS